MHKSLCDLAVHCNGGDELNRHPITIVWLDKLASLAGVQQFSGDIGMKIAEAFNAVERMAKEGCGHDL